MELVSMSLQVLQGGAACDCGADNWLDMFWIECLELRFVEGDMQCTGCVSAVNSLKLLHTEASLSSVIPSITVISPRLSLTPTLTHSSRNQRENLRSKKEK